MESIQKILGRFLKKKRMDKGWTQEELASRTGYEPETAKQEISHIEQGITPISEDKADKFIEALSIDEEWIIEILNAAVAQKTQSDQAEDGKEKDSELSSAENASTDEEIYSANREHLKRLKELVDDGLIDENEYKEIKGKILKKMFSI